MDKTILKNFAIYSRNKLIQETKLKAAMLGISEKGITKPLPESTSDMLAFDIQSIDTHKIYESDVRKYHRLVDELNNRTKTSEDYLTAYTSLIEEVAYTWFNRLLAIRFMEVNNYMPDRVRVLSNSQKGISEPEIMSQYNATSIEFSQSEEEQLIEWQLDGSAQAMNYMFQFLFINQCNKLNDNLPDLFEKTDDYTELLLTVSYNDQEGVLYKLVNEIPEAYFDIESSDSYGQIEIIGWMYQYYNTELKDEVFARKTTGPRSKYDIPAITQLFTTDWVVKYMIDNSLGKYWLERNPNSSIKDSLEFLMPGDIEYVDEKISPEDLKVLDNAMGSGHILIYAFDVLMNIYTSEGYTQREAAKLIIENNLYGLDIDKRSYQLAYFALMMKARQYNRRILEQEVSNNIYVFEDSNKINLEHLHNMGLSIGEDHRKKAIKEIIYLVKSFENAKEIGSILIVDEINKDLLIKFINDNNTSGQLDMNTMHIEESINKLKNIINIANVLTLKYDVIATNPPYLGKFSSDLKKYINANYEDYNKDLFSVFTYKNINMIKKDGYSAFMTPFVWMFINSYLKLREYILSNKKIDSLIQLEYSAFEDATVPICTFVIKNCTNMTKGNYIKLSDFKGGMEVQRQKTLEAINSTISSYHYRIKQTDFFKIPKMRLSFWASQKFIDLLKDSKELSFYAEACTGMQTNNNPLFTRYWHEVNINDINLDERNKKWNLYLMGGLAKKWYGNVDRIVCWKDEGQKVKEYKGSVIRNEKYYFKKGISWKRITSSSNTIRVLPENFIFDQSADSLFVEDEVFYYYILGLLNTRVIEIILELISPTLNLTSGTVKDIPLYVDGRSIIKINKIVKENINYSLIDWDSFETSKGFRKHPLYFLNSNEAKVEKFYEEYKDKVNLNFSNIMLNEERLNSIFINIYKLQDEVSYKVSEKDITLTKIFDSKEDIYEDIKGNHYIQTKEDVIKSFISYAVGCMFGRYSLDEEGLIYAGGEWDISRYKKFIPTSDNVLIISEYEYFEDDIVNRFVDFVKFVYGEDTLDENLEFIADALGGRGTPKEVIRNYFVKDFYKHHVQMYKKRPIYWLYDSGRNNGFIALVYMHRYNEDTTGVVRIDHLHKMQTAYEHRMDNLRYEITHSDNARDRNIAEKDLDKLTKQLKESKDYDEKIGHLAVARIGIDLDDGVKVNHAKVQTDEKGNNLNILAKI